MNPVAIANGKTVAAKPPGSFEALMNHPLTTLKAL